MADLINLYKFDGTIRTSVSATLEEIVPYTINWADLTGAGFANGDEVLILHKLNLSCTGNSELGQNDIRQGSTYAGASTLKNNSAETGGIELGRQQVSLHRVTLATNDNIYTSMAITNGAGPVSGGDFTVLVLKLGDLTEGVDFLYDEFTGPASAAPATDTVAASVTLPAGGGDDWLILSDTYWDVVAGLSGTLVGHFKVTLNGADQAVNTFQGEDVTDLLSFGVATYYAAAPGSAVVESVFSAAATTDYQMLNSRVFALRLQAFASNTGVYDNTPIAYSGFMDVFVETNSDTLTMANGGDMLFVVGESTTNGSSSGSAPYCRVEIDAAEPIAGQGATPQSIFNTIGTASMTAFGVTAVNSGARALVVDCTDGAANNAYDYVEHSLVGISLALAGGPAPTVPVLSNPTLPVYNP